MPHGIDTVAPGSSLGSRAPNLPPIDLPEAPPARPGPLQVTVHPRTRLPADDGWASSVPDYKPPERAPERGQGRPAASSAPTTTAADDGWASNLPDYSPAVEHAMRHAYEIGASEAFARGIGSGVSFGSAPALEGVAAASGIPQPTDFAGRSSGEAALRPIKGAWNLIRENIIDPMRGVNPAGISSLVTGDKAGPATKAYRKARDEAEGRLEAARDQYPKTAFAGEFFGALGAPIPGGGALMEGGNLLTRLGRGAWTGAKGGAAYGAGSAISRGAEPTNIEGLKEIGESAAENAAVGAGLGGPLHGILGPRAPRTGAAATAGERAARTAEGLGAPLPRVSARRCRGGSRPTVRPSTPRPRKCGRSRCSDRGSVRR
jgi:hypothetical protein